MSEQIREEKKVDISCSDAVKKLTPMEKKLVEQLVIGISKWTKEEKDKFIERKQDLETKMYADINTSGEKFLDSKLKKIVNKNVHIGEVRFPFEVVKRILLCGDFVKDFQLKEVDQPFDKKKLDD